MLDRRATMRGSDPHRQPMTSERIGCVAQAALSEPAPIF
jgi:hypothetical protein